MKLDLFLASMMRSNADLARRLHAAHITEQQLREAQEQAKSAGFLSSRAVPVPDFIDFFGTPYETHGTRLRYQPELWPDHYYDFTITEWGGGVHRGFTLKEQVIPPVAPLPLQLEPLRAHFRIGHHTMTEVEQLLGQPEKNHGWEAMEDWLYGPVKRKQYISIEFDFRLLSAIELRRHVALGA